MEALSFIGTLLSLIVVGTTLWVGLDASRLMSGIPKAKRAEIGGKTFGAPRSPAGWVAGCMLLWIVFFPLYLRKRQKYLAFQREKFMEEYNRLRAEGAEPISWEEAEASKKTAFPVIAFLLIAINIILWVVMEGAGGSSEPLVLVRFGAQLNELVAAGQYWRLLSSMFLHIGLEHLALNCLALMLFAPIIESSYGRARFLGLYLISGYFGNLLFLAFGQSTVVSAGASGAIFGVLGAHIPLAKRLKERQIAGMGPRGLAGLGYVVWVFVRSMGLGINVLAHFGGVIAGLVLGRVLCPVSLRVGEQEAVQPRVVKKKLAGRAAAIGLVLLALTVAGIFASPAWRERGEEAVGRSFARFPKRPDSLGSEARIELRQKFPPGKYEMVTSMVTDGVVRMKEQTARQYSSQTTWFEIKSSQPDPSGQTTCVMTIKRMQEFGTEGNVDTDNPASLRRGQTGLVFGRMVGREFVVKFGPDWELVSVSGLDEMWDAIADVAEAETPGSGELVRKQFKEGLGDYVGKSLLHLAYQVMPVGPVGVGAIWHTTESVILPIVGKAKSNIELELTGIEETSEGRIANIAIASDMRSGKASETVVVTSRGMDLRQKGTMRLDLDTGLLLQSESKTSGTMRLAVRGREGKSVVPSTVTMNITERMTLRPIPGGEDIEQVASDVTLAMKPATPIRVGEEAREFTLKTVGGKMFSLALFKGKKVVVLGIGNPYT
jgi:rhomboid protease GluP